MGSSTQKTGTWGLRSEGSCCWALLGTLGNIAKHDRTGWHSRILSGDSPAALKLGTKLPATSLHVSCILDSLIVSCSAALSKQMHPHVRQSGDEHSEAAGPCLRAGILLEAFGTESEASCSYFFQVPFFHGFLGGTLLPIQTCKAGQTSAPIGAAGVAVHSATSGPQL